MSEREPRHAVERAPDWNREALARALDATPHAAHHVGWGDGDVHRVGQEPDFPTTLVIFPAAGVARVTTRQAEITLFRQQSPHIYEDQVRFEQLASDERLQLTLTRRGRLRLEIAPGALEPAATPVALPSDPDPRFSAAPPVQDDPGAEMTPSTASPDDPETGSGAEQDRVRLVGRLGAAPHFRTTRNDVLIATFPLAVRQYDDTTTWHSVKAFRERAVKIQEANLHKGQIAEVVGYRHTREQPGKDGTTKLVTEVYAVLVKPR